MDFQKMIESSERAAQYFEKVLDENGKLKAADVAEDLASVYKLPSLLISTGRGRLAHKVLNDIKARFLQSDGDFLSYPELEGRARKTKNVEIQYYWPYMNMWVAMAAHRLGRFDISVPAWRFVQTFYNPRVGAFGTAGPYDPESNGTKYDIGLFMSSHLGLAALYFGDLEKARTTGDWMVKIISEQPALDKYILLQARGDTGELIAEGPEGKKQYYRLDNTKPKELYYQLGYPVFFLYYLSLATGGEQKYIQAAEKILDFALTCDESLYTYFLTHKVAYGAGLIGQLTGKQKYLDLCSRVVAYLLTTQTEEGDFLPELEDQPRLDQTAEIPIWLRELANNLVG